MPVSTANSQPVYSSPLQSPAPGNFIHPMDRKHSWPKLTSVVVVLLIVALVGALVFVSYKYVEATKSPAVAGVSKQAEAEIVKERLANIIKLPAEEDINIVKVENPEVYKQQDPNFYQDLEVGQYLVAFVSSQKVFIYDRQQDKIVNFSSYTLIPQLIDENTISDSEKPLKIEVRYVSQVEKESVDAISANIAKLSKYYQVIGTNPAKLTEYKGITLVVLNKGGKPKLTENFKNQVAVSPGKKYFLESLPSGESPTESDILLIIGER